jgi:hypothetical protein
MSIQVKMFILRLLGQVKSLKNVEQNRPVKETFYRRPILKMQTNFGLGSRKAISEMWLQVQVIC